MQRISPWRLSPRPWSSRIPFTLPAWPRPPALAVHGLPCSPPPALFTSTGLIELLLRADDLVASDRDAGESTLVVVAVAEDGRLVGASSGDSGAMVIRLGAGDVTGGVDDLTRGQHRKRRLGSGRALPIAFERAALDGTLLVATDGLFSYAGSEVLVKIIAGHEDLEEAAGALVKAVRLPGGSLQDDVAVAVVRAVRR